MKRTALRSKAPAPRPVKVIQYQPRPRAAAVAVADQRARLVVPVPKAEPLQHQGYMAAVRKLPCASCGIVGFTQFCHADEGKGTGIKSDCRLGWPGCGPHDGVPGCHYLIGTQRVLPKAERRQFEAAAGAATRKQILAMGLWPARLPHWNDENA